MDDRWPPPMPRDEYLAWCKKRALEYLDRGEAAEAVASMLSDLGKHKDFRGIAEKMALLGVWTLTQNDRREVRRFIEGFR